MKVELRYRSVSGVRELPAGPVLAFEPNLARPKVFFDAELSNPTRFREAICALHEVVVGDLKFKKKDKAAYAAYQQEQAQKEAELKQVLFDQSKRVEIARIAAEPVPDGLEADFQHAHRLYWRARREWAAELSQSDPELFRHLVPCDPVVTVAPDVVFFECFAKDESSYGCLSIDRGAFRFATVAGLGTTNVDYSLALYEHFQTLRSYRNTRLLVDPSGFEVTTDDQSRCREEQIDLPSSWLRGFGQLQAAMALPGRTLRLTPDVVYSILAHLKRNREKTGPRSLRFELRPGEPPTVHLDPWGLSVLSSGEPHEGPAETIKVWGRRRLFVFARLLPMVDHFEVLLLGSGLPSVWIAHMGEMRFTLALSGWTAADWTQGANLDQLFASFQADPVTVEALSGALLVSRQASVKELCAQLGTPENAVLGGLHVLAKRGQVVYDFADKTYRWRPILPDALSESALGPEHPELIEGRRLTTEVHCVRDEAVDGGKRLLVAKVQGTSCEALVDSDGVLGRGRCSCSYFHRNRLRTGPCRHLVALRLHAYDRIALEPTPRVVAVDPASPVGTQPIMQEQGSDRCPVDWRMEEAVWGELEEEAARREVSLSEVAEQAWRIARVRVAQASSDDVRTASAARTGPGEAARRLELHAEIDAELREQASRLAVDPGSLFEFAWSLARGPMRITSSVLDPKD